jgi:hypothetical protein
MNYKLVYYKDISKNEWDSYVKQMPEAGYHHSWSWLNYITQFPNIKENVSFVCLGDSKSILGICPLAISFNEKGAYMEMSFGGNPCGTPLIADVKPSLRRKILDYIFCSILSITQEFNVKKICMVWDPLTISFCTGSFFHKNMFDLLRYQMIYYAENIVVVDLDLSEETIREGVSKYQRRHIQRAEKKGVIVKAFNSNVNSADIKTYFDLFQEAHFKSAGRKTRPQETWDAMADGLLANEATLLVAFIESTPISFLYCGEFGLMAFGWSQVNIDEYESEYSPRHILEWKAMMFYKTRKFKYYEVGERYYGPQLFHHVTGKEISISVLKERFGGFLLPKIRWTGYCDQKLLVDDFNGEIAEFLSNSLVMKLPEY